MTQLPEAELDQAEIKRGAAMLRHLLTWRGGFGNDEAVRSLRNAKLDAAVAAPDSGRPCMHQAVARWTIGAVRHGKAGGAVLRTSRVRAMFAVA